MDHAGRDLFEAALAEDPEDLAAWQAYADWLCERGDPHGELMQVQMRLEQPELAEPQRKRLEQHFAEILTTHRVAILGPEFGSTSNPFEIFHGTRGVMLRAPAPEPAASDASRSGELVTPSQIPQRRPCAILYRGWLSHLWGDDEAPLPALLNAPAARLLQSLQMFFWWEDPVALLRGKRFLAVLRELRCGELNADLAAVCRQMVRLEQLTCDAWDAHAQGVVAALPTVRSLGIGGDAGDARFVPTPELRQVQRLEWKSTSQPSAEALASPFLQNVRSLSLLYVPGRATIRALRESGLASRLESLEIIFGSFTTTDSVAELARLTSDNPKLCLQLRGVTISPAAEAALRAASPATQIELMSALRKK